MKTIMILILLLAPLGALAECKQFYHKPISIPNSIEFCKSFFAVVYDTKHNRPILTSEILIPKKLTFKKRPKFRNEFGVPYVIENHVKGYDKGHLTPAGDASTYWDFIDTFTYINSVHQSPALNRGDWRQMEENIRDIVNLTDKEVIIVTGAIYEEGIIPKYLYKVVFFDVPVVYFAENRDNAIIKNVSIEEIEQTSQIDLD